MQLYGEDISGSEIILAELRAEFRKSGQPHDRVGNPSRYFFKPIESLFVDRAPERANSGQISRGSLSAIWEWITQILLPAMARDFCEKMKHVIVADKPQEARLIAAGFQSKVVKCLEGVVASEEGIAAARSGLGMYTSSRASFDDLTKMLLALQARDAIAAFNEALPPKVESLEGEALARVRDLLDAFANRHPKAVPFALTMVAKRLKTPWQLIYLATEGVRCQRVSEIAERRYAIGIPMVLDHLDDKRVSLNHAMKSNRTLIAKDILCDIYDIEYAVRDSIDRLDESEWGRRLHDFMAALAADLETEFRTLPENIHHVLGSDRLHRDHPHGLLGFLSLKGRHALNGGVSYLEKLMGSGHR